MSKLKPRLSEILDDFQFRVQRRIFTTLAGKVTAVAGRTVTLQILQQYPGEEPITCAEVPVVQISTDRLRISIGVDVDDEGLVVFHKLDPSDALRLNDVTVIKNWREHGLYAEFIPRRASEATEWPTYPEPNEIVIGDYDGNVEIRLDGDAGEVSIVGNVNLGAVSPADAIALASKVDQNLTTLKTAVAAGLTAVGAGAAANGPAGATTFNGAFTPQPVGSNTIKAQ